jgi:hypothetical protein
MNHGAERLFFSIVCVLLSSAAASTDETPNADQTLSPYFFVQSDDPTVDRLPLLSTLELRLEAFNVTNSPHFMNPNGEYGSATFGQVTATLPDSARTVRFGARFEF